MDVPAECEIHCIFCRCRFPLAIMAIVNVAEMAKEEATSIATPQKTKRSLQKSKTFTQKLMEQRAELAAETATGSKRQPPSPAGGGAETKAERVQRLESKRSVSGEVGTAAAVGDQEIVNM